MRGLDPPESPPADLSAALRQIAEEASRWSGVRCTFAQDHPRPHVDRDTAVILVRSARELVHNALKHAGAGCIVIDLRPSDHGLSLTVRDDGEGFERPSIRGGLGLRSIHRGAAKLGGELSVHSNPGEGTVARLCVPVAPRGNPRKETRRVDSCTAR